MRQLISFYLDVIVTMKMNNFCPKRRDQPATTHVVKIQMIVIWFEVHHSVENQVVKSFGC